MFKDAEKSEAFLLQLFFQTEIPQKLLKKEKLFESISDKKVQSKKILLKTLRLHILRRERDHRTPKNDIKEKT